MKILNFKLPLILFCSVLLMTACKSKKETVSKEETAQQEEEKLDNQFSSLEEEKAESGESHTNKEETTVKSTEDSLLIAIHRTPCFGRCPVYKIHVYESGFTTYEGINFVDDIGFYKGTASKEIIEAIFAQAKEIDFFNLEDEYDGPVTDLPSTIMTLVKDGKEKKVKCRYRCPKEVVDFGKFIDNQFKTVEWEPYRDK